MIEGLPIIDPRGAEDAGDRVIPPKPCCRRIDDSSWCGRTDEHSKDDCIPGWALAHRPPPQPLPPNPLDRGRVRR